MSLKDVDDMTMNLYEFSEFMETVDAFSISHKRGKNLTPILLDDAIMLFCADSWDAVLEVWTTDAQDPRHG